MNIVGIKENICSDTWQGSEKDLHTQEQDYCNSALQQGKDIEFNFE